MAEDEESTNVPANNHGSTSSSASNPCPICLGPFTQESYLDQCFHKFCYNCILHWAKVVVGKHSQTSSSLKCPLCKTENLSIIYAYDGISFERHYFSHCAGSSTFFSNAHKYRLQCYYTEPGAVSQMFDLTRFWKLRKYLQQNQWLQSWVRRELQALTQEEDVDIILHHLVGVIDSFRRKEQQKHIRSIPEMTREEFKALLSEAARPFLTGRTERFVEELELFIASGLTIDAFDKTYMHHLRQKLSKLAIEEEEGEDCEHGPFVPNLFLFDEDSLENE